MGLVSSLYRMAPSPASTGPDRRDRARAAVRRVLDIHGLPTVRAGLAAAAPGEIRDGLLVTVEVEAVRGWIRR